MKARGTMRFTAKELAKFKEDAYADGYHDGWQAGVIDLQKDIRSVLGLVTKEDE